MATTLIGIAPGSRTAERFFSDVQVTNYSQRYIVTSASTDSQDDVLATSGLPTLWDTHPDDASARVVRVRIADNNMARTYWLVDVEYSTEDDTGQDPNSDPGGSPVDLSADVSWSYETIQFPLTKDSTGKDIATTAGEAFTDPPITIPLPVSVLTWSRWRASFGGGAEQQAFMGKVNQNAWQGALIHQLMVTGISADLERIQGVPLWRVTDVLKLHPIGWDLIVPNKGTQFKDGSAIVSKKNKLPIKAFLNAAGDAVSTTPTTQFFQPYGEFDFASRYGA